MKKLTVAILFLTCFTLTGYSQKQTKGKETKTGNKTEQDTIKFGWPKDIHGLIDHLNNWDKNELEAYESHNYITSGETDGWVEEHERILKKLGTNVYWYQVKKQYELKNDN